MPRNNTPMIIGAVLFGIVALGLTFFLLRPAPPTPPPTPVVETTATQFVAARDIPPRTSITGNMIREETIEKTKIPPTAITERSQLAGFISSAPIARGEVITKEIVVKTVGRVTPVFFQVPTGTRAVAIFVDQNATAAGLVDVGDRIDVIANLKVNIKTTAALQGGGTSVSARTIAQNLQVLAVDRSLNQAPPTPTPAPAAPGAAPAPPPPPPPAPTPPPAKTRVIVAADPVTAEHLTAANEAGNLHITIRNPAEIDNVPRPEVFEYPTRIVSTPAERRTIDRISNTLNRQLDVLEGRRPIRPRIDRSGMQAPTFGGPILPPMPTGGGGSLPAPSGGVGRNTTLPPPTPADKEVTVIRGTEKTRVIVPANGSGR